MSVQKGNYIYSRICNDWKSTDSTKVIEKLGCTQYIEYRKWWGATERLYPSTYKWYIDIKDLGRFPSIVSAEQTIFQHSFFLSRNIDNGVGSGVEFYEFAQYEHSLQKACEVLTQYDVVFTIVEGDPFLNKPIDIPIQEECLPYDEPLSLLTHGEQKSLKLRDYQQECVRQMLSVNKGIIVAATGIGKTMIMCMYMKEFGGRYLIVVPSQKLVNQTMKTCKNILGIVFTVSNYNKRPYNLLDLQNIVIVALYQSSHKLKNIEGLNCIIFDECHNTVVLKGSNSNNVCEEKEEYSRFQQLLNYSCKKKFFFTATEKNIQSNREVISMDNEKVYGPVIFRYDLSRATSDGWLCDYLFHLVATKNKTVSCIKYIKRGYKTIIFCGKQKTVEQVYKELCVCLQDKHLPTTIDVYKLGEYDDIETVTNAFSDCIGQAVIVACRKITMGYDEPQVDTVIHCDLSTSSIMTHQRNGRAFRLHRDKVMATLVFLCDVSGSEREERLEQIRNLHRPVVYMKEIDKRFEERLEKERTKSSNEFSQIKVFVEGVFTNIEYKEIYNKCWEAVDGSEISYKKAKDIIKLSKPHPKSWADYIDLCYKDRRLYENPEEEYINVFEGRVVYLGLNHADYYTKEEYTRMFNTQQTTVINLSEICDRLHENDSKCPPTDLVIDMYNIYQLSDLISYSKKKRNCFFDR